MALTGTTISRMDRQTEIKLAVRELVEKTERTGDLNFRFSSRSSAQEGIKGHQKVQRSRGEGYVAEEKVSGVFEVEGLVIEIVGRVDGYQLEPSVTGATDRIVWVEEIKTTRMDVSQIPENIARLNWGQARVYAHLLALKQHLSNEQNLVIKLCYYNLDDGVEYLQEENWSCADLAASFDEMLRRYARWRRKYLAWQTLRNETLTALDFPFKRYRKGQREMAVSVYQAMKNHQQLVMQAPTGIGKTMASIFPSLKAMSEYGYDKLFYLSAKTSGQSMAAAALDDLRGQGLVFRDITLTAKEKICFTPGAPCDAEHCVYAKGYYDKLPVVLEEVLEKGNSLTKGVIEALGHKFSICPFELSLDLSEIADMVICDYNYVFDPAVYLRRYFLDSNADEAHGKYGFLIDEAHNLVDRGRDMFSAELVKETLLAHKRDQKYALPLVSKRLNAVNREILNLIRPRKEMLEADGYLLLETYPDRLATSLKKFCDAAEEWLHEHPLPQNQNAIMQEGLLSAYFDCLRFLRLGELYNSNYSCLIIRRSGQTIVKLYNINPAPGLSAGLKRSFAAVCFSATMGPQPYFQSLMGISEEANWYKIPAPFDPAHLGVFVPRYISTTYRDRDNSLDDLVNLIADVVGHRAGNYLIFFPSYVYLNEVLATFCVRFPQFNTVYQTPAMDDAARTGFMEMFETPGSKTEVQETLVGFAIMGGVFGEGIDLKGNRLIGVVVVGVGLPQLGIERDLIKHYFDGELQLDDTREPDKNHVTGTGFEFAYQYPGINRVLQTAGRLIRSESDRGILCLVDNRFNEHRYRRLLPSHWKMEGVKSPAQLNRAIEGFWRGSDNPLRL